MSLNIEQYFNALPRFATRGAAALKPGLERITALLAAMDDPHLRYRTVHIAGTHGKGSTASMLAAMLSAGGQRVGLHTSPHLCDVRERMRVNGAPAPEEWLRDAVGRYKFALDAIGVSYFEATLALSLLYFAEEKVEWAVVEAGLGGRLDATNVLQPGLAIITRIGLDHTDILGATLEAIAGEKGGIIKPETPSLFATQEREARAVLQARAETCSAPWHAVEDEVSLQDLEEGVRGNLLTVMTPIQQYDRLECSLAGAPQLENACTALRAGELLQISEEAIRTGLRDVRRLSGLRGRLELLRQRPYIIADAGHSIESMIQSMRFISALPVTPDQPGRQPPIHPGKSNKPAGSLKILFGFMRDRDPIPVAQLFSRNNAGVWVAALPSERSWPPIELEDALHAENVSILGVGPAAEGYDELSRGLEPEDILLITGSFQLLGALPEIFCGAAAFE